MLAVPLALSNRPVLVVSGEDSLGTWLSGAMLVACCAFSLHLWKMRGARPWSPLALFFGLLALDERFMFHESMKERIQVGFGDMSPPNIVSEFPVIGGALLGIAVCCALWRKLPSKGRALLVSGAVLGAASVAMDVLHQGALPEDACKLLAELCVLQALWAETGALRA
ncbi:MAG: hypothetical protein IPK50_02460 [Fibrobacterota bacterium]|nr:MAG: hypothetical protein IPK50_02460 [Fibrobacterota bacterium]